MQILTTRTYIHTHTCIDVYDHVLTHINRRTHTHTRTRAYTCPKYRYTPKTCIYRHTFVLILISIHTRTNADIQAYTYMESRVVKGKLKF